MQTIDQVRKDLQAIRYYYSRKGAFDAASAVTGEHSAVRLAERYNRAMRSAPPWQYDLYVGLYVRSNTQEALSLEMGYTQDYIQRENKKLMQYLQSHL